MGFRDYSFPEVDKIWLWVYYNKSPTDSIFYLLKGDHNPNIYPNSCIVVSIFFSIIPTL